MAKPCQNLSWRVGLSGLQRRLDALWLALGLVLLWPLLPIWGWLAAMLVALACWVWVGRQSVVFDLGFDGETWWRQYGNQAPVALVWRANSVRRAQHIVWRYGVWPWQIFIVRPDSLAPGEFRTLLVALH